MSPYLKLYLRVFLTVSILVGLLVAILGVPLLFGGGFDPWHGSTLIGVLKAVFIAMTGGAIVAGLAVLRQYLSVCRLPGGASPQAADVHQQRTFVLRMSFDEAFNACTGALRRFPRCKILFSDRGQGQIIASKPPSLADDMRFDEIAFTLRELDASHIQVELASRPARLNPLFIDGGSNLRNVEEIVDALHVADSQVLLRPAGPPGDADGLLRPAAAGLEADPRVLLRATASGEQDEAP